MTIDQSIATIFSALIAAFVGSWAASRFTLARAREERGFDRRLQWYERMVKALHELAQKIEIAITFEEDPRYAGSEFRAKSWIAVQRAHLELENASVEAAAYGTRSHNTAMEAIFATVQDVANDTAGFDESDVGANLERIRELPDKLRAASTPLRDEIRKQLGIRA